MGNPIKGEVGFKADEKDWTLVYDFNALCTIEEELGVDITDVGEQLTKPTMIRSVFRIGLQAKHGALSDLEAGHVIHAIGVPAAAEVIGKAFQAAFPEVSTGGKAAAPTPRKRGAGPAR